MPPTSGSAARSRASRPSRRRTKAARLSSVCARRRGRTRSRAMRSFPVQEKEALGQRVDAPAAGDVGAAVALAGADEVGGDADPLAEREPPRLLGDEGIGPALDDEAPHVLGSNRPAEMACRLEQHDLAAALDEAVGGGEPGHAAAHDGDAPAAHRAASSTTCASMRTNAGWSFTAAARANGSPSAAAVARASTSRS